MKDNYKKLGNYIQQVDIRNKDLKVTRLLGLSIEKRFIESIANTIGTDFRPYKVVKQGQFAYGPVTSRNGDKITIALLTEPECIISSSYSVFEITKTKELLPEFLMLWFSRPEFDRYARFKSHGSVREMFDWEEMCNVELPIPDINKQQKIVNIYNKIEKRIELIKLINLKLEDFSIKTFNKFQKLASTKKNLSDIANIIMGQSPSSNSYNNNKKGMLFYQGKTDFGFRLINERIYTTEPTKIAQANDILLSVRAPVGDINITDKKCCIGRGLAALSSKIGCQSYLYYTLKTLTKEFSVYNGDGTVFGAINQDNLCNLPIKVPSDDSIINFENKIKLIDKKIMLNCFELKKLYKLKQLTISNISKI